jgi:AcrR family transcriptional regulator
VAATSTRAIADRVGVRQASLYHHFVNKDEMLVELLSGSVRPSLELVQRIEDRVPASASAAGALYALAVSDVATLAASPHNVGALYLSPEVQHGPYAAFRQQRHQLQAAYGRLGAACADHAAVPSRELARIAAVLIQLAELVIQLRRTGEATEADADVIAAACLRACGLGGPRVALARQESARLLGELQGHPVTPGR